MKYCVEVKRIPSIVNYWGIYFCTGIEGPMELVDDSYSQEEAIRKGRSLCLDKAEELGVGIEFIVERTQQQSRLFGPTVEREN